MQYPLVKLGDLYEIVGGGTPSIHQDDYYGGNIPWATVRDMNCKVISSTERTITDKGLKESASNIIPAGNLIIATRVGLGKVCYILQDTAINQDLKGLIPKSSKICKDFTYYWLLATSDYIISKGIGATVQGVKLDFITNLKIPLPPLPVQQEIVARLEKELAKVDEMAESFKRMAELADEEFKSVLAETFEHVEGKKVKLGEIGNIVTGCTPSKSCSDYYGYDYPFFKPTDLNQGFNVSLASEFLSVQGWNISRQLPINSVLVTCIGATLGKVGIIREEGSCNQQINAIIPKLLPPEYVYFWILSPSFQSKLWYMSNATTLPIVSKSHFSKFEIIIPEKNTSKIVEFLIEAKNKKEDFISKSQKGLALCSELRKSILQEAFS
ncbi:MAG: restriction endonuclease subunit S [Lentisphaeria bacterium]|nr:restriction endonuclease subunit S [Lentisphaeria bacterium]